MRRDGSGGGVVGGAGPIPLVDVLVVVPVGGEQVMEDPEPAVGEAAKGGVVALPALPVLVVVGARPVRGGEGAEGPAQEGLAQEAVAGGAGDDDAGAAGGLGDRCGAGVGLQGGRGREPLATVA